MFQRTDVLCAISLARCGWLCTWHCTQGRKGTLVCLLFLALSFSGRRIPQLPPPRTITPERERGLYFIDRLAEFLFTSPAGANKCFLKIDSIPRAGNNNNGIFYIYLPPHQRPVMKFTLSLSLCVRFLGDRRVKKIAFAALRCLFFAGWSTKKSSAPFRREIINFPAGKQVLRTQLSTSTVSEVSIQYAHSHSRALVLFGFIVFIFHLLLAHTKQGR